MRAAGFPFTLCPLVVTWLPCVSLIYSFFFFLQRWPTVSRQQNSLCHGAQFLLKTIEAI